MSEGKKTMKIRVMKRSRNNLVSYRDRVSERSERQEWKDGKGM